MELVTEFNADHLIGLTIDDAGLGDPDTAFTNTLAPATAEDVQLDKDDFWEVFQLAFDLPGQFAHDLEPFGIQEDEIEAARKASDSMHALLLIYYPSALTPNSPVIMHLLTVAPFLWLKIQTVRLILARGNQQTTQENPPANSPENPVGEQNGNVLPFDTRKSGVFNKFGGD